MHPDGSHFGLLAESVEGLVTDVCDAYKHLLLLYGDGEVAALVRHATAKQQGVGRIEHGDIGVRHRVSLFVYDVASQPAVGLVDALHEDLLTVGVAVIHRHADRIEAYHLLNGIRQRLATDGGGDAEVLQLVIEKHYGVVRLLPGKPAEGIRERHIIIFAIHVFTFDNLLRPRANSQ